MKSLQEHLKEALNESVPPCQYDERKHILVYHLDSCEQEVKDKFDEIGMDITSEDEEFEYVNLEMHYDDKEIDLAVPYMDNFHIGMTWFSFKTKLDLIKYHDSGIGSPDLKPVTNAHTATGVDKDMDKKVMEFICWFFNSHPEPLFKTAPKGTTYKN